MAAKKVNAARKLWSGFPSKQMVFCLGFVITLSLPLLFFLMPTFLQYFNGKLYDAFLTRATHAGHSGRIVIVDVDDNSLSEHGQWPWPRYKIAAIIDRLNDAGAAAIGIDFVFPEKDRTSLTSIRDDLRQNLNLSIEFAESDHLPDNDHLLAEAISRSPSILGYQFLFDSPSNPHTGPLHPLNLAYPSEAIWAEHFPWRATDAICSLTVLSEAAQASGFFNVAPDSDGILRSTPMLIRYRNQLYPALALASVIKALKLEHVGLIQDINDCFLMLGRTAVPLNSHGALLARYRGKGRSFPYVSAADLLSGNVPQSRIEDNIVFVGTTAVGLKEFRSTPTDPIFPGVEVHATIADNLLSADFLSRPSSALGIEFLAALLCGVLYVLATRRTNALGSFMIYGISVSALVFVSFRLFEGRGVYLSPVLPLLVLTANFSLLNFLYFWLEEVKSKQYIYDLALAQGAIIESMAALTETRDCETGGHIKRTQEYVGLLANELKKDPAYRSVLTDEMIELLYRSAPLHDIGKVGISDRILLKPGRLTAVEFEEIKKHATIGKDLIEGIKKSIGNPPFIKIAHEITYTHHEKWDGSGYPKGLKGEQIPFSGRLMAIADMYDALTSRRVYKEPVLHEQAVQIMTECAPTSFDPHIFGTFLRIADEFKKVSLKFAEQVPNEPTYTKEEVAYTLVESDDQACQKQRLIPQEMLTAGLRLLRVRRK
jgi:HD-GYP domain-containing protein (c-di-GMP phosphodiesterase class II)/CHASE2 domain-containing sensor protein